MPFEKKSYGLLKTFSFFSSAEGRVDFVCFQAFRPNKVPFYNFFIAGRSALKKKRCSNRCNSRPISTTGCQQMCRDDDKTSPKGVCSPDHRFSSPTYFLSRQRKHHAQNYFVVLKLLHLLRAALCVRMCCFNAILFGISGTSSE